MERDQFWLETSDGKREPLTILNEEEALALARRLYPSDGEPDQWVAANFHYDDENTDMFLVLGGPDGEEFTWITREFFEMAGAVGLVQDAMNK